MKNIFTIAIVLIIASTSLYGAPKKNDLFKAAGFTPKTADFYFYTDLAHARKYTKQNNISLDDLVVLFFEDKISSEDKSIKRFYRYADKMLVVANSQELKKNSGILMFLTFKRNLPIKKLFPKIESEKHEGIRYYKLRKNKKIYILPKGNLYVVGFLDNLMDYQKAVKKRKSYNYSVMKQLRRQARKTTLYFYRPFSKYMKEEIEKIFSKGKGELKGLEKNIYLKALLEAKSMEMTSTLGKKISFQVIFTGNNRIQGKRLIMVSHFMIVSSSIAMTFIDKFIRQKNSLSKKNKSEDYSKEFNKFQSYFGRVTTSQRGNRVILGLTLSVKESNTFASVMKKAIRDQRKKVARKKRLKDIQKLYRAISRENKDEVEKLMKVIGTKEPITNSSGQSPLHIAVYNNNIEFMEYFIKKGVDVNIKTRFYGKTALYEAAARGYIKPVTILIKAKADVFLKERQGLTPLHAAAKNGNVEVCMLLLKKGAMVNARSRKGSTPLHEAAGQGNLEAVKLLVKWGADIKQKDSYGSTPADTAQTRNKEEVVQYLKSISAGK